MATWHRDEAFAGRRGAPAGPGLTFADAESGYLMMALVGIIDPPREEAMRAVKECHEAGIRVKMITGDHVETARAIGAQLAIGGEALVVIAAILFELALPLTALPRG